MTTTEISVQHFLSEAEIIDILCQDFNASIPHKLALAAGDDCALWNSRNGAQQVISVDTASIGTHFPQHAPPECIAYRALAASVSDLAAMGASPIGFVDALTLPRVQVPFVQALRTGLCAAAQRFQIPLMGGNIVRGDALSMTITVIGEILDGQALRRDQAQEDDDIYVSGTLGDAAAGLNLALDQQVANSVLSSDAQWLLQRYYQPAPRLALGQALRGIATAAIDLSDGLYNDLMQILCASRVSAILERDRIPLSAALQNHHNRTNQDTLQYQALSGGDDYELCFTAPKRYRAHLRQLARHLQLRISRIGHTIASKQPVLSLSPPLSIEPLPFSHFESEYN